MRRNRTLNSGKNDLFSELNNVLTAYYISGILFGIFSLYQLRLSISFLSIYNPVIFIFASFIFFQSVRGIIKVRKLRKSYLENPNSHNNMTIPKPILYHAIFWYLPK